MNALKRVRWITYNLIVAAHSDVTFVVLKRHTHLNRRLFRVISHNHEAHLIAWFGTCGNNVTDSNDINKTAGTIMQLNNCTWYKTLSLSPTITKQYKLLFTEENILRCVPGVI